MSTETLPKPFFSPDEQRSHALCVSAKAKLKDQPCDAERQLIDALLLRPSNMLAYQLLSELYRQRGKLEEAEQCRKSQLPDSSLALLSHRRSNNSTQARPVLDRQVLHVEDNVTLPRPGGLRDGLNCAPLPGHFNESLIKSKSCFVDRIVDGEFWHDSFHTQVFDAHGVEVKEHAMADAPLLDALMHNHSACHLCGRVFLIGARGAHNFYHWMTDIAPSLGVLREAGYQFKPEDRFVVAFARTGFTRQLLAQFGVSPAQVYETESNCAHLGADEVIVPFLSNKMGLTMGRWLPSLMRDYFLPQHRIKSRRRLFVVRESRSADGRGIENLSAVQELLQRRGFECVSPEKLPVNQQAILFAEAEIIIAAHGAALSNIVFCTQGTKVVEFYAGHIAPCYWAISALCGLDYYQLYSAPEKEPLDASNQSLARSGNLHVPLTGLDEILALLD